MADHICGYKGARTGVAFPNFQVTDREISLTFCAINDSMGPIALRALSDNIPAQLNFHHVAEEQVHIFTTFAKGEAFCNWHRDLFMAVPTGP